MVNLLYFRSNIINPLIYFISNHVIMSEVITTFIISSEMVNMLN